MLSIEAELERKHAMRLALATWAEAHHKLLAARDGLIRDAVAAGIPKTEIAKLVRLNRSYLYDLLAKRPTESPLSAHFLRSHNGTTAVRT